MNNIEIGVELYIFKIEFLLFFFGVVEMFILCDLDSERFWLVFELVFNEVLDCFIEMRKKEGVVMVVDFVCNCDMIISEIELVVGFVDCVVVYY